MAVSGVFAPAEALSRLLAYSFLDRASVVVRFAVATVSAKQQHPNIWEYIHETSLHPYRTTRAEKVPAGMANYASGANENSCLGDSHAKAEVDEVLVNAQKRNERLQDVPVSVSALSTQPPIDDNQVRVEDLYANAADSKLAPSLRCEQAPCIRRYQCDAEHQSERSSAYLLVGWSAGWPAWSYQYRRLPQGRPRRCFDGASKWASPSRRE